MVVSCRLMMQLRFGLICITVSHKTNLPRTFSLIHQIQDLRQGSMDLSSYYTALKTLWDILDGAEPPEMCLCCNTFSCISQYAAKAKGERGRII